VQVVEGCMAIESFRGFYMLNAAARRFDRAGAAPEGSDTMTRKTHPFWGGFFRWNFWQRKRGK